MRHRCLWLLLGVGLAVMESTAETVNLILTSSTHSHFEACGCSDHSIGGLESRAAIFNSIRQEATPSIFIDIGGFLPQPDQAKKSEPEIDQALGIAYVRGMKELGYDIVALGIGELRYDLAYLQNLSDETGMKFLCTNVDSPDSSAVVSSIVNEAGGFKFGFISVSWLSQDMKVGKSQWEMLDPSQAISAAAQRLKDEEKVDAVVLLAYEPPPVIVNWSMNYQGFKPDLIVTMDYGISVQRIKEMHVTNAPSKGRSIGIASLELTPGEGITNMKFQRVLLDPETMQNKTMRDFLEDTYSSLVNRLDLEYKGQPVLQDLDLEQNYATMYAGSESCMDCHREEYDQWAQTKHALAFNSLLEMNRHWIPECAMCHVTGFGSSSGYQNFSKTPEFIHVQCETCHGPGQYHIDNFGTGEIRRTPNKELCLQCHDQANSPEFEKLYDLYYKKIEH